MAAVTDGTGNRRHPVCQREPCERTKGRGRGRGRRSMGAAENYGYQTIPAPRNKMEAPVYSKKKRWKLLGGCDLFPVPQNQMRARRKVRAPPASDALPSVVEGRNRKMPVKPGYEVSHSHTPWSGSRISHLSSQMLQGEPIPSASLPQDPMDLEIRDRLSNTKRKCLWNFLTK